MDEALADLKFADGRLPAEAGGRQPVGVRESTELLERNIARVRTREEVGV